MAHDFAILEAEHVEEVRAEEEVHAGSVARLTRGAQTAKGRYIYGGMEVEGVFRIVGERLQRIISYRRISLNILRRDGQGFSVRTIDRPEPAQQATVRLHEPLRVGRNP